jgi:FAD/FMN-containing dehydrogenase
MSATTETSQLEQGSVRSFARGFRGRVVLPDHPDYATRRQVWNGSIDKRPALIVRCADAEDVAAAVRFARDQGLVIAVRGGGHSFPGFSVCDGGIVIDLSPMNAIRTDPDRRRVRVGAGALLGAVDRATQAHGLAIPTGIVTHTGVAGLTLGGGLGWLTRRLGLSIDQLLGVDLVTADGEQVRAQPGENAELFWALRGGGGNFGIVTAFDFRLHEVGPTVLAGPIFWPVAQSPALMRFYRDWVADAPEELMTIVVHRRAPVADWVPVSLQALPVASVVACWCGSIEAGERVLRPLREFGTPALDLCRPTSFVKHQAMFDPSFPAGWHYYMRACDVDELTDDVIDITAEQAGKITSSLTTFPIWHLGGAMSRVAEDATAFHGRSARYTFNITGITEHADGFAEERDWVRGFWDALSPYHTSVYVNFLMDEGDQRVRQAYGSQKYERLRCIKAAYDPDNLFRLNQNIVPAA